MKVRIVSPATVTGGPELLHQLCNSLRTAGVDAAMCYTPFGEVHEKPSAYRNYDAPNVPFEDSSDVFFVIPESRTGLAEFISKGRVAIWWLSLNNYLERKPFSDTSDPKSIPINRGWRHRVSLDRMKELDLIHLSQSQHTTEYLALNGIPSLPLGDYVNEEYLRSDGERGAERLNAIAYNPKKGIRRARKLIRMHSDFDWVPLENMSRAEMIETLQSVKLYMDFGSHPGRDRIPREAAICGACVVTGRDGSAANAIDIPISGKYKLDAGKPDFAIRFREIARDIFQSFDAHSASFDDYRSRIIQEQSEFERQVRIVFGHLLEATGNRSHRNREAS